jgi:hypothetical protein
MASLIPNDSQSEAAPPLVEPQPDLRHSTAGPRLASSIVTQTIAADLATGLTRSEIARKYNISNGTVSYHIMKVRQSQMARARGERPDYKSQMLVTAVRAVNAGLRCKEDPYRRATIGVAVLKGLGEFEGDSTKVEVKVGCQEDPITSRYLAIHGRYPTESEKLALAAKPVDGERIEEKEQV